MAQNSPQPSAASKLHASHTPHAIAERLDAEPRQQYLRDFVYGAVDGAVTTFAVVSGVAGAQLPATIVIVLGVANLIADGFSMAASNFLANRAEGQLRDRARRTEEFHIAHIPEGEREEIRQIFARKGLSGDDLERMVDIITSNKEQWLQTMLNEELGLSLAGPTPWRAAAATFVAFVAVGALPLLPFLAQAAIPGIRYPFAWSAVATALAFVAVGALKARFVGRRWYWSSLETLAVGGSAAIIAYCVGVLLKDIA